MMILSQSDLDYIAISVAHKLAEILKDPEEEWISQNKAFKKYGGRRFVTMLRSQRKVRTRIVANRVEYYTKDLLKHSIPQNLKR